MFYGRAAEISALDELLNRAAAGRSGALVLRGEAGIGKTALLSRTAEAAAAAGFRVLRGTGTEAESTLPYAGLHLLLGRERARLTALPPAQADALHAAFSSGAGQGNSFLVGAATLTLLADLAEEQPLLCLIDDAQWIDPATLDAILFAARRLDAERIALVFAARDDATPELRHLDAPELHLAGLSEHDARTLMTAAHSELPPAAQSWVLRESHGNPLALQVLPTLDRPEHTYSSPYRQPAAAVRIQQAFTAQIARLPHTVRNALLIAATDASGETTVIRTATANLESGTVEHPSVTAADQAAIRATPGPPGRAIDSTTTDGTADSAVRARCETTGENDRADALPDGESPCARMVVVVPSADALARADEAVLAAEQAGLLVLEGDRIRFRHPLMRAAAHEAATPAQRRAAHAALAMTLVESFDDRRAWHLAAAATGPDERAAAALEAAALCARARGGLAETTAAYQRAAALSPVAWDRQRRYAGAAYAASDAGDFDAALEFVQQAMAPTAPDVAMVLPPMPQLGQLTSLQALIERELDRPRDAYRTLTYIGHLLAKTEPDMAGRLLFQAAESAWSAGDLDSVRQTATQTEQLGLAAAPRVRALAEMIDALNLEPGTQQRGAAALRELTAWMESERLHKARLPAATDTAMRSGADSQPGGAAAVRSGADSQPSGAAAVRPDADSQPGGAAAVRPDADSQPSGAAAVRSGADPQPGGAAASHAGSALSPDNRWRVPGHANGVAPHNDPMIGRDVDCLRERVQLVHWHLLMGEMPAARGLAATLEEDCRSIGALGVLAPVLWLRSRVEIILGQLGRADVAASEAMRLAADTGQRVAHSNAAAALALLAALRGDEDACRALVSEPLARGIAPASIHAEAALGLLELATGRPEAAYDRFTTMLAGPNRHGGTASVPDLIEAAHRIGRTEAVRDRLEVYVNWTHHSGHSWALAIGQRCRALLADDDAAGKHFEAALEFHYASSEYLFERARTEVLYGEWLRRRQQRADARRHLRSASEIFERLGARPWAKRAANELRATGETRTTAADTDLLTRLTPQERQTVQLAAEGLSNKDIAAKLFLSPRTVGYHLSNAYPKLGITSRRELAAFRG
ncbi:helix-turn-helix domain-containing protein [Nocardia sp. 2]|uniref:Helix-turn-helix domain-containing protein n=1 Tax=Nocardia acididurans TaxID=2802282 RepID=A0ABS1LYY6_9NOCA|nr:LuxR family transcriptional regulator [Nocardia acididurans]MBL1073469.1 helix-turn-helix domain-containing protein [Nocardia acididurans]